MARNDQQDHAKGVGDPAHTFTKEEARAIVAPLYEALNEPLKKTSQRCSRKPLAESAMRGNSAT